MKFFSRVGAAGVSLTTAMAGAAVLASGVPAAGVDRPAGPDPVTVYEIRSFASAEVGVPEPTGLAYDPTRDQLLLLEDAGSDTRTVEITSDERRVGQQLLRGASDAGTVAVAPDGTTTAVTGQQLLRYSGDGTKRNQTGDLELTSPDGATYLASGELAVLDDGSVVISGTDGDVTRIDLAVADSHELVGLTSSAETDLLYTYDATADELVGVTGTGDVAERYDLSDVALTEVQGIAIAPSADGTDDPGTLSLFLADSGGPDAQGSLVEASLVEPMAAALLAADGNLVRSVETSQYSPPSPDPSGIAYIPDADRLFIVDGEVDEMGIFEGSNFFATTRAGSLQDTGVSQPWSDEPVGAGYNPTDNHLWVSDDDQKEVFEIAAGGDGRFGTNDDTVTNFDTNSHGNTDPEGIDYDWATDSVWTVDGVNREVFRVRAGPDGTFGTSDDVRSSFDVGAYGARDPEGLAYDPVRDTIAIVDDGSETIYELDRSGGLLNTISLAGTSIQAAAGLAVAPGSQNETQRNYYVVARGLDNDSHPTENDGVLYEFTANLPPMGGGNQAPLVDAGQDQSVVLPDSATLDGTVTDDGLPDPPGAVTTSWSKVSGFGDVTFGDASAVDTTASFSVEGTYVLALTANDGEATRVDQVTVVVSPEGSPLATQASVATGSDDAEQTDSGFVGLTSSDLELGADGNTPQVVGTRFANLQVPAGATITNAYVQFRTDEASTDPTSLTIRAELADNTPTYQGVNGNVTAREVTVANVAWTPSAWNTVGEQGAAQRTPNVASLVQRVVDRVGWQQGNALALQISGTGRRTAEAFEGGSPAVLHVEYSTGPVSNRAPVVDAGPNQSVVLPDAASLDGTVSDDNLPDPPSLTTTWAKVSGPGTVTFGDASAVDTTAAFSVDGSYVLSLTADDGELSTTDQVAVTVEPEGATQSTQASVATGSDDAEQALTGFVGLTSSDLELGADGNTPQVVGTRFANLQVPAGATITNAYVQFRTDEASTDPTSLTIRAELADNTPTYQAVSGNVTAREVTVANVAWSPPAWNTVGEQGPAQRTPNVASLVQRVVDRAGWQQGNALALQIDGSGRRTAESLDGGFAPVLHVEYSTGPVSNRAPVVDAGPDQGVILPDSASLDGTVNDDGLPTPPGALTTTWAKVSGPGTVTFGDASAVDTTAAFSVDGSYVLSLTADDGELSTTDQVAVTVEPEGTSQSLTLALATGADDAEERYNGSVLPNSSDLDITADGSRYMTAVGLRFAGVDLPRGATIVDAYVQFRADETGSGAADLTIRAQAADNAPAFTSTSGGLSSRSTTQSSASWSPPAWNTVGESGAPQRTSNLGAVLQEIVDRGGWSSGNAVALLITGTADRTADSFEGGFAPVLHVEYSTGPVSNRAPVVNAGPNQTVILPDSASLDGTVNDDGLPTPPGALTTTWAKVSGPGTVTFGDASAVDTTAAFSVDGSYVLSLTADDGELSTTDQVAVTVAPEGTTQSLTIALADGADDAEERYNGSVLLNSRDLDITADGSRYMSAVGVRFTGVTLPQGATIVDAYVQFRADETGSGAADLTIRAQAADNAPAFTGAAGELTSRPLTAAAAAWAPAAWNTVGESGAPQRTGNLAAVLQEIVNRGGWSSGNAIALLISGTADRTAESGDNSSGAPVLHIEYQQ